VGAPADAQSRWLQFGTVQERVIDEEGTSESNATPGHPLTGANRPSLEDAEGRAWFVDSIDKDVYYGGPGSDEAAWYTSDQAIMYDAPLHDAQAAASDVFGRNASATEVQYV